MKTIEIDPDRRRTQGKKSMAEKLLAPKRKSPKKSISGICVYQTMKIGMYPTHFYIHKTGIKIRQMKAKSDVFKFISWKQLFNIADIDEPNPEKSKKQMYE